MKYRFEAIRYSSVHTINGNPCTAIEYVLAHHAGVPGAVRETTEHLVQVFEGNNLSKLKREIRIFEQANPSAEVWLVQG